MIYGQLNQIFVGYWVKGDWIEGCIVVIDVEIEEIFVLVCIGIEVEIWL